MWRKFARLSLREKFLLVEAALLLTLARLAIALAPFRWLAPLLGRARAESRDDPSPAQSEQAEQIGWAVETMSRHTFGKSTCLAQAIAAQLMLKRRGIASTLYLGVSKARPERSEGNGAPEMAAHAWVRCGSAILTGAGGHAQYTVVAAFGDGGES